MNDKFNKKLAQSYKRNTSIVRVLGACIVLCLVFCSGFLLRGNVDFLSSLGFSDLVVQGSSSAKSSKDSEDSSLAARISEVDELIDSDSSYDYDLDSMTSEVLQAYAQAVKDPFFRYYDAASYQKYLKSATEVDQGIGILFSENDSKVSVSDVLESSRAQADGIESGDYVIAIDGQERSDWTLPDVLAALKRDEGDSVLVKFGRQSDSGKQSSYDVTLMYHNDSSTNVTYTLENQVGVIKVKQISADSASVVKDAVKECQDKGATSFVLDLRNVPGGYLTQAVGIASLFMDGGTVVQVKTTDGTTSKIAEGSRLASAPLVVLVNGQTSGSAEVLAAALQESNRAQIVGVNTQGKATVQLMKPLSFGGALRYTVATYLTAKGRSFDKVGVTPDVTQTGSSKQRSRAIEMARSEAS